MESKYIEIGKIIYLPEIGPVKCIEMTINESCSDCALYSDHRCLNYTCNKGYRLDKTNVYFVKVDISNNKYIEAFKQSYCYDICELNSDNCMDNRVECPLGIFKKLIIKIENEKQK